MSLTLKNINPIERGKAALGFSAAVNELLRTIEWDKKYLWRIKFIPWGSSLTDVALGALNIPPMFLDGFPAIDIDVGKAVLNAWEKEVYMSGVKIPLNTSVREIKITFLDDVNGALEKWISDWINVDILNCGRFTSCLYDSHQRCQGFGKVQPLRKLMVERLNEQGNFAFANFYDVFPVGELSWNGAYTSESQSYSMGFVIVKDYSTKPTTGLAALDAGVSDITNLVSNSIFG